LVFGGVEFDPQKFLANSPLESLVDAVVLRGSKCPDGSLAKESWIEFDDVHEGKYPLDMGWEAADFLAEHREEFLRLSRFPGVTSRSLNFFGDMDSCDLTFEPERIALLNDLSLRLSITPYF